MKERRWMWKSCKGGESCCSRDFPCGQVWIQGCSSMNSQSKNSSGWQQVVFLYGAENGECQWRHSVHLDQFYKVLIIDNKFKLYNTWMEWNLFSKYWNREKAIVTGTTSVILGSSVSQRGNYSKGGWFSELVLDIKVLEIWNYLHFQLYEVPITWRIMGRWRWLLWTKVWRYVDNTCINRKFFSMHNP